MEEKEEIMDQDELAFNMLSRFIGECAEMAEKNWTEPQIHMLERLFGAVLSGVEYADWKKEEETNE